MTFRGKPPSTKRGERVMTVTAMKVDVISLIKRSDGFQPTDIIEIKADTVIGMK